MSFNIGLSGLKAASERLNVTGNNIANSNTVGFKSSRTEFADIYNSNGGSGTNIGSGVKLAFVRQSFVPGVLNSTGNTLDMGIQGSGFFILNDGGSKVYTRAGAFALDNQGFITNSSNQRLTGLLADPLGNITAATGDLQINGANIAPRASTSAAVAVNLSSSGIKKPPTVDWSGGASPAADTYTERNSSVIYDSLGNSHILDMYFIKADANATPGSPNAGAQNQWYVSFQIDNQDVPPLINPPPATTNVSNLYAMQFDTDGGFTGITDSSGSPLADNLIPLGLNLNNGSDPLSFNVDITKSTQYASVYTEISIINDGYTTGQLKNLSVDDSGIISGIYSNGQSLKMGQIQLATFAAQDELQCIGNTCWSETLASGPALVSAGGQSLVKSQYLEDSNVDLTSQLVDLISAQQAFQANAKTISTEDQTVQAIFNIR